MKLSERMNTCTAYCSLFAPEVAALESSLVAKDAEIARLCEASYELLEAHVSLIEAATRTSPEVCSEVVKMRAALAETPAAPKEPITATLTIDANILAGQILLLLNGDGDWEDRESAIRSICHDPRRRGRTRPAGA